MNKEDEKQLAAVLESLKELLTRQQKLSLANWNRSLPFGEYISDRWGKAAQLGFGEGSSVYDSAIILGDVSVGKNTWVGPFTILDGSGGLVIGDNCSISAGVQIYSHDTVGWALSGGKDSAARAPVTIGNNCYIGPNATISMGVIIGDGCVVGANSFVNKNLEPNSRAWGVPARVRA